MRNERLRFYLADAVDQIVANGNNYYSNRKQMAIVI